MAITIAKINCKNQLQKSISISKIKKSIKKPEVQVLLKLLTSIF